MSHSFLPFVSEKHPFRSQAIRPTLAENINGIKLNLKNPCLVIFNYTPLSLIMDSFQQLSFIFNLHMWLQDKKDQVITSGYIENFRLQNLYSEQKHTRGSIP